MLIGPINSGAAVGADGVATATGTSSIPVNGFIYSVQVRYNDSPPAATTDVTIKTKGTTPAAPSITIWSKANSATDGIFPARIDTYKASDGSALSTNDALIPVSDYVQVVIAQANAADSVDVWLEVIY
jgi:hypothetical protein